MALYERIAELESAHARFAVATVVGRRSPVSSHLGDRALVFGDGRMEGFVGGSCSRDIVRRQALVAIDRRRPLLLQIRPDAQALSATESWAGDGAARAEQADDDASAARAATASVETERVVIPMGCSSQGAVDIYIEPHVPLRQLVVVGLTPVAEALTRLAVALDYAVIRVVHASELRDIEPAGAGRTTAAARVIELGALPQLLAALDERARRDLVAVVASQGHYDEIALETLLVHPLAFAGLLASRKRAATVRRILAQNGLPPHCLDAIHNPVGLDIGARSPGDVAVSILAQIIASTTAVASSAASAEVGGARDTTAATMPAETALDPVCGMDVEPAGAMYICEHAGSAYYFCSAGCRTSFAADPQRYVLHATPA